jgi:hypothetical protein
MTLVARTMGVRLHVYPAKGYSSTFPIKADGLDHGLRHRAHRRLDRWAG